MCVLGGCRAPRPALQSGPLRDRREARIRFSHQRQRAGYGRRSVHSARRRAQGHLCGWRHQRDLSRRIDLVRQFPLRATAAGAACGHRCRRPLPGSRRRSRAARSAGVRRNTDPAAARCRDREHHGRADAAIVPARAGASPEDGANRGACRPRPARRFAASSNGRRCSMRRAGSLPASWCGPPPWTRASSIRRT